jgi:tRNA pseudouridine55 synthase
MTLGADNSTEHGLLVIDKPSGITSRDAVNRVQRWFPPRTRIGHTGTLDPLATGVLVICVGRATRLAEYVQRMAKTYETRLYLGADSDTDDADGHILERSGASEPATRAAVERCLHDFIGDIEQVPPAYSAARVTGRRAYNLARRGVDVELKPRRISVHAIELLGYDYPRLELRVHCGKGTYIRSLARDLGHRLGCGAYVETLRRTHVGPFVANDALPLDTDAESVRERLLPCRAAVAELPSLSLTEPDISKLRMGQRIAYPAHGVLPASKSGAGELAVVDQIENLVGIVTVSDDGELVPLKMLN